MSFSIGDEVGLPVEGGGPRPDMIQSHNPPYYAELLAVLGFPKILGAEPSKIFPIFEKDI
ncbi:MAG: hypothetical protein A2Z73_03455 [Deltaproteobacteria bacterium RBG_13_60_28]|nr:MAG: hypothetical protein A2Z73_03455 [Deltaproteobacteria bacterium RBG_13_60_28]